MNTKHTSMLKYFIRTVATTSNGNYTKLETNLKSWREIPGPSALPIIGQLHHYFAGGELSDIAGLNGLQKLYDKYGPMVRLNSVLGLDTMILLGDPEVVAHVLRSENKLPMRPGFVSLDYYRKDYKRSKGYNVQSTGLVTEQGETWRKFRTTVNPVMLQPKTIKLYSDVIDEVAMDMIKRMKSNRDEKNIIRGSFIHEMNLWALESIGTVALGCRLNCLDSSLPKDSPQNELIRCVHAFFHVSNELDFKPSIWKYFSTPMYKKAMKLYERQEIIIKYFIRRSMEQLRLNNSSKLDYEKGVLEKLLEISEETAIIMASDMLVGGIDTISNTMIATLYLLATHQDKQDKIREEILSKSDKKLYLKACIKESLRVMPVVSGNIRRTTKEYNLFGYRIPKGMNIAFTHREMSLMDHHYYRALEYIPERWLVDKNDPLYYGNAPQLASSPFGFGIRSCIGRRIAELEIETFLGRFIESFKVEWSGPPPKVVQTSIRSLQEPFYFIFSDVK